MAFSTSNSEKHQSLPSVRKEMEVSNHAAVSNPFLIIVEEKRGGRMNMEEFGDKTEGCPNYWVLWKVNLKSRLADKLRTSVLFLTYSGMVQLSLFLMCVSDFPWLRTTWWQMGEAKPLVLCRNWSMVSAFKFQA